LRFAGLRFAGGFVCLRRDLKRGSALMAKIRVVRALLVAASTRFHSDAAYHTQEQIKREIRIPYTNISVSHGAERAED